MTPATFCTNNEDTLPKHIQEEILKFNHKRMYQVWSEQLSGECRLWIYTRKTMEPWNLSSKSNEVLHLAVYITRLASAYMQNPFSLLVLDYMSDENNIKRPELKKALYHAMDKSRQGESQEFQTADNMVRSFFCDDIYKTINSILIKHAYVHPREQFDGIANYWFSERTICIDGVLFTAPPLKTIGQGQRITPIKKRALNKNEKDMMKYA